MSSTDATQRMLIQEQDSARVSTADVIVENAGTQNDLRTQAQMLFEKWSTQ
jgi:dephospho-CoA kinase